MEYFEIALKTILFYFLLIFILRIMGKREVGELSIFDIVVFFFITELFSLAIDKDEPIEKSLIPIAAIVIMQLLTSFITLKFSKLRYLIEGKPTIIIFKSKIVQKEMKKQKYSLDDLFSQLREQGVDSIESVEYAILEANGRLSIIKKDDNSGTFPLPIIEDGILSLENLNYINKDKSWLLKELSKHGVKDEKDVFLLLYKKSGSFIVLKSFIDKKWIH